MVLTLEFVTGENEDGTDIIDKKIFVVNRIDAIFVRRSLEIKNEIGDGNIPPEVLDNALNFVCEVYRNKFTIDDLYRGVESCKLMDVVSKTIVGIMGNVTDKLDTFPTSK